MIFLSLSPFNFLVSNCVLHQYLQSNLIRCLNLFVQGNCELYMYHVRVTRNEVNEVNTVVVGNVGVKYSFI